MARAKVRFILPAGASWQQPPSASESEAVHRDAFRLRTGYRLAILEVLHDSHPAHLHGRNVVLALWTDTGARAGIVGFPVEDWPRLRDIINDVALGEDNR